METLSTKEVSELLKVKKTTVYDMVKRGDLPAARVGRNYIFLLEDVHTYIADRMLSPNPPKADNWEDIIVEVTINEHNDIVLMMSAPTQYIIIEEHHREKLAQLVAELKRTE